MAAASSVRSRDILQHLMTCRRRTNRHLYGTIAPQGIDTENENNIMTQACAASLNDLHLKVYRPVSRLQRHVVVMLHSDAF